MIQPNLKAQHQTPHALQTYQIQAHLVKIGSSSLQVFVLLGTSKLLQTIKNTHNTSILTGQMYITELLDGNDEQFLDMMRMQKPIFKILCNQIAKNPVGTVSRLPLEEQVAIFFYIVGPHQAVEQLRINFSTAAKQFKVKNILNLQLLASSIRASPPTQNFTNTLINFWGIGQHTHSCIPLSIC
ncbi:uncharacterized protein VP01_604g3 [Puccinia sorghi]|uniref:DUF8040 domain-containing protein n=1 Tax=Puccinia sorghi TaxID=27349 RepID=A0A0L6UHA6_9BASI|nr:uncharacterized protein VP01_604g3 [Puccinia sorghi]